MGGSSTRRAGRAAALALLVVSVLISGLPAARAEVVETTIATAMHERAGESTRVVVELEPGTRLEVVKREGRWIRVRLGRRRGWIPRTTVQPVGASQRITPRPTHWSQRPVRALGDREPAAVGADRTAVAVADGAEVAGESAELTARAAAEPGASGRQATPLGASRLEVGVGMQAIGMTFASDGQTGTGNYRIAARAASVALAGRLVVAGSDGGLLVAVDGHDRVGSSSPGIRYASSSGEIADIPFTTHEASAGVWLGYRAGRLAGGASLAARIGYHYSAFLPRDLDNLGKLPRESLRGATVGLRLELPRLRDRLSLAVEADLLVGGQRSQTLGLSDGTPTEVRAVWGGASLSFPVAGRLGFQGSYRLGRASTSWQGPSSRQADVSAASRDDAEHVLLLGLCYAR